MDDKTVDQLSKENVKLKEKIKELNEINRKLRRDVLELNRSAVVQAQLIQRLKTENTSLKEIQELYKTK